MMHSYFPVPRWYAVLLAALVLCAMTLAAGPAAAEADRTSYDTATGLTDEDSGDPIDSNDYGTGDSGDDGDIDRGEGGLVTALDPDPVYTTVIVPEPVFIQLPGTWYRVPIMRRLPLHLHRLFGGKAYAR